MNLIDYAYYEWLVSNIHNPTNKTYLGLFERLHNVEFQWTVPNDDNRIQDALDLRREFLDGTKRTLNLHGATMLEILVSLSRRMEFIAGGKSPQWAWKLLKNLRLHKKSDPLTNEDLNAIDEILYALIWREYREDGLGGFFPLDQPKEDQTKVEIWYQMNQYVIEKNLL